jgi:Family of unknown function (DUF6152)
LYSFRSGSHAVKIGYRVAKRIDKAVATFWMQKTCQIESPSTSGSDFNRRWKNETHLTTVLVSVTLVAMAGATMAHHSFAMFDQANPIDLAGVVKDWRYTAPRVFIVPTQVGNLEDNTPSASPPDGWTAKTLKPGDELILKIDPLRSSAPGAVFN